MKLIDGVHPNRPFEPLIINACLTGVVNKPGQSRTPMTISEIIEDACEVIECGATILHCHARDADGNNTWDPEVFGNIFTGIRRHHPEVVLCATCSGRVQNTYETRSAVLMLDGDAKPDMGSLTLGSMNFITGPSINSPEMIQKLATTMVERGIIPEMEVFDHGMLNYGLYLASRGVLKPPYYVNVLLGSLGTIPARAEDLCTMTKDIPGEWIWAGAGIGKFQLPINTLSIVMGGHVRVGLEDNIYYDYNKDIKATNADLVKRLVRVSNELMRPISTIAQTRAKLNLRCCFP
jgi:uncharacterized protein (DUF849 family)